MYDGLQQRHRFAEAMNPIVKAQKSSFALVRFDQLDEWIDRLGREEIATFNEGKPSASEPRGVWWNLHRPAHVLLGQVVDDSHRSSGT
jgi:hypothetical protein